MPMIGAGNIQLCYEQSGDGEPLLIIAGLGDHMGNWQGVIRRLSKSFRVIAFDNRGVGHSDAPDEPYTIDQMATDTLNLLDALNISRCHVLGFSMGGYIAQRIAIEHPDRISKLILVATRPGFGKPFPVSPEVNAMMGDRSTDVDAMTRRYHALFGPRYKQAFGPDSFIRFKQNDNRSRSPHGYFRQLKAVLHFDNTAHIHEITHPTLILVGTDDQLSSPDNSRWMHQKISHSTLIELEGVGHLIPVEAPTECVQNVITFITAD